FGGWGSGRRTMTARRPRRCLLRRRSRRLLPFRLVSFSLRLNTLLRFLLNLFLDLRDVFLSLVLLRLAAARRLLFVCFCLRIASSLLITMADCANIGADPASSAQAGFPVSNRSADEIWNNRQAIFQHQ